LGLQEPSCLRRLSRFAQPPLPLHALHQAAQNGDSARVEALLADGADVALLDRHGQPPLSIASLRGHAEVV